MAKKKKKEQLPEGMSRRQAKLAARAAERAAFERDPRPYELLPIIRTEKSETRFGEFLYASTQ
ncbi:hypothetical protein AY495_08690 [Corynebacterium diphtheriae bv. mitis]|nr:hypothetical protein AY495_08690 [Corynebacterium diphtheriae bv. mitis]